MYFFKENVIEMAKKLTEMRFVWQYNGLKNYLPKKLPENLYIDSWLPQQDLLGKLVIKLFKM